MHTGLRLGEAIGLTVNDEIDKGSKKLYTF